jgi:hypothetical protein
MSILNESLNLFGAPLEDNSIETEDYLSFSPDDFSHGGINKTKFTISVKDMDNWINWSKAYLEYSVKLKANDGVTDIADGADIALQQGHIWERVEMNVDSQTIESVSFANIASNMHNLACIGPNYKNTVGAQMNMHLDTNLGAPAVAGAPANEGFIKRKALAGRNGGANAGLQTFYYPVKHLVGYANQNKCTRGLRHQMVLYRNTHANMVHQAGGAPAGTKVFIERVRLWCPIVRPSLQAVVDIENKLNSGMPMQMHWQARNMYRSGVIGANDLSFEYRVTTSLTNAEHCFVAMIPSAFDDTETENTAIFYNQNLSEAHLRVNSVQVPKEKLELSFPYATRNVARAYQMFEEYKNVFGDAETGSCVSKTDYTNIFPIIHFDLTKQVEDATFGVNGNADITFRGRRSQAGNDMHIYFLILSSRSAEISGPSNNLRLELL